MSESATEDSYDPRPRCPKCVSREVHFYGGALFYIDRKGVPQLYEPKLPKDPDAPAWCESCEWSGPRCDLADPPELFGLAEGGE